MDVNIELNDRKSNSIDPLAMAEDCKTLMSIMGMSYRESFDTLVDSKKWNGKLVDINFGDDELYGWIPKRLVLNAHNASIIFNEVMMQSPCLRIVAYEIATYTEKTLKDNARHKELTNRMEELKKEWQKVRTELDTLRSQATGLTASKADEVFKFTPFGIEIRDFYRRGKFDE